MHLNFEGRMRVTKVLIGGLLMSTFIGACKSRQKPSVPVSIFYFEKIEQYCGGAAPSEELMEELSLPRPLTETTVYIYPNGEYGEVEPYVLKTDKKGKASVRLPEGQYGIHLHTPETARELWKKYDSLNVDSLCFMEFECMSKFDLPHTPKGNTEMHIPIMLECNPCLPPAP
jgi:hypothetical protein